MAFIILIYYSLIDNPLLAEAGDTVTPQREAVSSLQWHTVGDTTLTLPSESASTRKSIPTSTDESTERSGLCAATSFLPHTTDTEISPAETVLSVTYLSPNECSDLTSIIHKCEQAVEEYITAQQELPSNGKWKTKLLL